MDSDYLDVILGRIEMRADSVSAAAVFRNNIFASSRDPGSHRAVVEPALVYDAETISPSASLSVILGGNVFRKEQCDGFKLHLFLEG